MSATSTAASSRIVEIESRINALYQPDRGKIEYRLLNAKGDFIIATSNWKADRYMTDEEVKEFYTDRQESIETDFSEGIRMRY